MSNCSQNPTSNVTFTLGLGSTTTPYVGLLNVTTRLCTKVCVDSGFIFNPTVKFLSLASLGNNAYVATFSLQGAYIYTPCSSNCCQSTVQDVNTTFNVPISSATTITTATPTVSNVINAVVANDCQKCGRYAASDIVLSIAVK